MSDEGDPCAHFNELLLVGLLAKPNAGPSAVLLYELNPSFFQSRAESIPGFYAPTNLSARHFEPLNGRVRDPRGYGQV